MGVLWARPARARVHGCPNPDKGKGAPIRHRCAATVRRASPLVSLPSRRSGRAGFCLSAEPTCKTTSAVFCIHTLTLGYAIPGAAAPDLPPETGRRAARRRRERERGTGPSEAARTRQDGGREAYGG